MFLIVFGLYDKSRTNLGNPFEFYLENVGHQSDHVRHCCASLVEHKPLGIPFDVGVLAKNLFAATPPSLGQREIKAASNIADSSIAVHELAAHM